MDHTWNRKDKNVISRRSRISFCIIYCSSVQSIKTARRERDQRGQSECNETELEPAMKLIWEKKRNRHRSLFAENGRSRVASFKLLFTRDIIGRGLATVHEPRNGHWKWVGIIHSIRVYMYAYVYRRREKKERYYIFLIFQGTSIKCSKIRHVSSLEHN